MVTYGKSKFNKNKSTMIKNTINHLIIWWPGMNFVICPQTFLKFVKLLLQFFRLTNLALDPAFIFIWAGALTFIIGFTGIIN